MPDRIGIVALDLDGTLLDSQKRLSDANRAALARIASEGVQVVPTTGRFFGMMPEVVRGLPFVRYAITVNGAEVYDRVEDVVVAREEIPLSEAVEVMKVLDGFDVVYDCYRNGWGWMTASLQAKAADNQRRDRPRGGIHFCRDFAAFCEDIRRVFPPDLHPHLFRPAQR